MRFEDGSPSFMMPSKNTRFQQKSGNLADLGCVSGWGYIFLMDLRSGRNDAIMQSWKAKAKQDAKEESSYL